MVPARLLAIPMLCANVTVVSQVKTVNSLAMAFAMVNFPLVARQKYLELQIIFVVKMEVAHILPMQLTLGHRGFVPTKLKDQIYASVPAKTIVRLQASAILMELAQWRRTFQMEHPVTLFRMAAVSLVYALVVLHPFHQKVRQHDLQFPLYLLPHLRYFLVAALLALRKY